MIYRKTIDQKLISRIALLLFVILLLSTDASSCSDVPDWEQRAPGIVLIK